MEYFAFFIENNYSLLDVVVSYIIVLIMYKIVEDKKDER